MWQRDRASSPQEEYLWLLLAGLLLSPPALVGGLALWFCRQHPPRRMAGAAWQWMLQSQIALGGAALLGLLLWLACFGLWLPLLGSLLHALLSSSVAGSVWPLLGLWAWGLLLTPVLTMVGEMIPLPPALQFQMQQRASARQQQQAEQHAAQVLTTAAPASASGALLLGTVVESTLPWTQQGWFAIPASDLGHAVLIGKTGSGKTETILRLAVEARHLGWQVLYLDGKGNETMATRFLGAMAQAGAARLASFPAQPYDGWRGTPREVYNRYLAIQPFSQEWYQRVAQAVLWQAIGTQPSGPTSSAEFLRRLHSVNLAALLPHSTRKKAGGQGDEVQGVWLRYQSFFATVGDQLDGRWAFEDVDAAYLQLGGLDLKAEANSLGRFFLEEGAQYVVQRKPLGQPVLFIVDELSALGEGVGAAVDLFERSRSYAAHVVVSSQSDAALGDQAERLLKATTLLLVHRYSYPEAVLAEVGKEMQLEQSWQQDTWGQSIGRDMLRQRDVYRIAPERIRALPTGTVAVLASGRGAIVRVAPIVSAPAPMSPVDSPRRLGSVADLWPDALDSDAVEGTEETEELGNPPFPVPPSALPGPDD